MRVSSGGATAAWSRYGFLQSSLRHPPLGVAGHGCNDYFYMDANCNQVAPGANLKLCGFAAVIVSPISLIWEDGVSLADGMTVVPFSIDTRQPRPLPSGRRQKKRRSWSTIPHIPARSPPPSNFSAPTHSAVRQPRPTSRLLPIRRNKNPVGERLRNAGTARYES